jgi:hypothetical protein
LGFECHGWDYELHFDIGTHKYLPKINRKPKVEEVQYHARVSR